VLSARKHVGPLCVQRPFYPDADGTCHIYVLHPPGGVAGGDSLELDARLGPHARALLTTPAATKLYRMEGRSARVRQTLTVQDGAILQWLPQETIAFEGAVGQLETRIVLEGTGQAIAWEMLCLGRPVCDERFTYGTLRTTLAVHRDGRPLLVERARFDGGAAMLDASFGMQGKPVLGTFICTEGDDSLVDALRAALDREDAPWRGCVAVSRLYGVVVCRYLGARVEHGQLAFRCALDVLTERVLGSTRNIPRIWLT
jgi:urease accessory protein